MQPFNDERMIFENGMYILTPYALEERGYDIRNKATSLQLSNPTLAVNGFLLSVSELVYDFIHSHNTNNKLQDELIARVPTLRQIIYRALLAQAVYMLMNGDLSLSTADEDAGKEYAPRMKSALNTTVPEMSACILFTGRLDRWISLLS